MARADADLSPRVHRLQPVVDGGRVFELLYELVFRYTSSFTHSMPMAVNKLIEPVQDGVVILPEGTDGATTRPRVRALDLRSDALCRERDTGLGRRAREFWRGPGTGAASQSASSARVGWLLLLASETMLSPVLTMPRSNGTQT